jgi:hypothetical protein
MSNDTGIYKKRTSDHSFTSSKCYELFDDLDPNSPLPEPADPAQLYFDGEMSQLKVATDPATIKAERREKINSNKHNPSRTGTEQGCDLAKSFPDANTKLSELMIVGKKNTPIYKKVKSEIDDAKFLYGLNLGVKEETLLTIAAAIPEVEDFARKKHKIQHGSLANGMIDRNTQMVPDMKVMIEGMTRRLSKSVYFGKVRRKY